MTILKTDLVNTRESARRIRVESFGLLDATNVQKALEQFASALPSATTVREVTAAGVVTVTTSDLEVGINKTVGAATTVNLPAAGTWAGRLTEFALVIKDLKGDAQTNNITLVPSGLETIEGLATYPIAQDYGLARLRPRADLTGWWVR